MGVTKQYENLGNETRVQEMEVKYQEEHQEGKDPEHCYEQGNHKSIKVGAEGIMGKKGGRSD